MVNCEFKKNYNFFLGMMMFSIVGFVATIIIAIAMNLYGVMAPGIIFIALGVYCLIKYLKLKKQFLKIDENGMSAYVITYKSAQTPTKIDTKPGFITEAYNNHNVLILKNIRGEELKIYNLKDAKKAKDDINDFIRNKK